MIIITISHFKQKLRLTAKLLLIILFLSFLVPKLYISLTKAGSFQRWGEKKELPGEPIRAEEQSKEDLSVINSILTSLKEKYEGKRKTP